MNNVMPFDELNTFKEQVAIHFDEAGHIRSKEDEEEASEGEAKIVEDDADNGENETGGAA